MTLHTLSTDALEIILSYVDNSDKANLLMTGDTKLSTNLVQTPTSISILPLKLIGSEMESLAQDDEGFHVVNRYKYEEYDDIYESVECTAGETQSMYRRLLLCYMNARSASIYDALLLHTLHRLTKLDSLEVYFRRDVSRYLHMAPNTLTTLHLHMQVECDVNAVLKNLPQTLIKLSVRIYGVDNIILSPETMCMLPQTLESLSGISVNSDELASLLPLSLTHLNCGDLYNVSPFMLRSTLCHIEANIVDVSTLAHLPLHTLRCKLDSVDSLLPLHSLTKLSAFVTCSKDNDWDSPVNFPPSLTELWLNSLRAICYQIPVSVKKLTLSAFSQHNVFEVGTGTWTYDGFNNRIYVPSGVIRAHLKFGYLTQNDADVLFSKLHHVEYLSANASTYEVLTQHFNGFTNCKTLILSHSIEALSLPPSITHMDVPNICYDEGEVTMPSTLQHLATPDILSADEVRSLSALMHLECDGVEIIDDIDCVSHIPSVVLRIPVYKENNLPKRSNIEYKYYEEDDE